MRTFRTISALAVAALAVAGCEDITNPVEEVGEFAPPWVGFSTVSGTAPHGGFVPVIFTAPGRPEQDIEIDFTFGGTAVFGEDYVIVTDPESGTPRSDVTAAGGTALIPYDPAAESPHDTLWVFIPTDAVAGRQLEVNMTAARGTGGQVTLGHLGDFTVHTRTITLAPASIPEGTYAGQQTGFANAPAEVTITDNPITVDGVQYRYRISDYANMLHGVEVGWAFIVFLNGEVQFAPRSHTHAVTADLTGTYDFDTNTLSYHVQFSPTIEWEMELTLQD